MYKNIVFVCVEFYVDNVTLWILNVFILPYMSNSVSWENTSKLIFNFCFQYRKKTFIFTQEGA